MATAVSPDNRNPPVDYAVAVWLGTPKAELGKGLREGWIRAPAGVDVRSWAEQRGLSLGDESVQSVSARPIAPPAPDESSSLPSEPPASIELEGRIEALLQHLDPAMDAATFDRAWQEAGGDDAARGAAFVAFLGRELDVALDPAVDVATQLADVEDRAAAHVGASQFIRIAASTSRELEALAANAGNVRRALAEHSPWVLAGDPSLAGVGDAGGRYDRFDPDTGEPLISDAWIADRAKHDAWRHAQAAGRAPEVEGEGWRFVDRAANDAMTTEVAGNGGAPLHQVVFATDDSDRVVGADGTDRIHGGRGDDLLRGRAGDDLLEGGAGSDVLLGGAGADVLVGQQGADELDGGSGDDDLSGGGGNDELIGGRGNDSLRGGAGKDTYRFDAGDGNDVIEDDSGVLIVDDVPVSGAMHREGDRWLSQDGRLRFTIQDEGSTRSLVIRRPSSGDNDEPASVIRIASWSDGSFGISLADSADEAAAVPASDESLDATDAGNEAPLGMRSPLAAPSPDDDVAQHATSESAGPIPGGTDGFGPSADGAQALIDVPDLSSALDQWTAPQPIDREMGSEVTIGVTPFDVGDALATADFEADDGEGMGNLFVDISSLSVPHRNDAPRVPPELALRTSP